jgi:hypothetical protein
MKKQQTTVYQLIVLMFDIYIPTIKKLYYYILHNFLLPVYENHKKF